MFGFRAALCSVLAAALIVCGSAAARAELISTASALGSERQSPAQAARERVSALLARSDLRDRLEELGVSPEEVQARLGTLSDAQVVALDGRLSEVPAGGDFLGVMAAILVTLILVLLITDLMGWTDVFPFVSPLPRGNKPR